MTNTQSVQLLLVRVIEALKAGGKLDLKHSEEFDDGYYFSCHQSPRLREASNTIGEFSSGQEVYCPFQTFDSGHLIPLKIHGLMPLDLQGDNKGKFMMIVEVVPDVSGKTVFYVDKDGNQTKAGDMFVAFGSFYKRLWHFWPISKETPAVLAAQEPKETNIQRAFRLEQERFLHGKQHEENASVFQILSGSPMNEFLGSHSTGSGCSLIVGPQVATTSIPSLELRNVSCLMFSYYKRDEQDWFVFIADIGGAVASIDAFGFWYKAFGKDNPKGSGVIPAFQVVGNYCPVMGKGELFKVG